MAIREFGSEYDWQANEGFWRTEESGGAPFGNAAYYRSGRDALKAVAMCCAGTYRQVLMPALCCSSMVDPFEMHGIQPVFYRLRPDYRAELADVRAKLTADTVLLYAPYFAIDPFTKEELEQLRRDFPGVLFLEDRTQDLLTPRETGFSADVTVASLRKWTAIPDGGLLWTQKWQLPAAAQEESFAAMRTEAMQQKAAYLRSGDAALKDSFRHLLGEASDLLDVSKLPYAMAEASIRLMERLDIPKMLRCRQENALRLQAGLGRAAAVQPVTRSPERSTLYFPVLVPDQARFQRELAARGIYCPVTWPVPEGAKGICPVAEYTAAHMLGIPCDHRYTPADMDFIAEEIVRLCHEQ